MLFRSLSSFSFFISLFFLRIFIFSLLHYTLPLPAETGGAENSLKRVAGRNDGPGGGGDSGEELDPMANCLPPPGEERSFHILNNLVLLFMLLINSHQSMLLSLFILLCSISFFSRSPSLFSLLLSLSLSVCPSLSLSLSLSHTHSISLTLSLSISLSFSLSLYLSFSPSLFLSLSPSLLQPINHRQPHPELQETKVMMPQVSCLR